MTNPGSLIRSARRSAGLSQVELARRSGTTQSAIARLERGSGNPRVATLDRLLRECGVRLELAARRPNVDETLVARNLRMTPDQRLAAFQESYADAREIALARRRAGG
jgi:transcriptional regulator with XRE-family HTH domain